MFTLQEIMSYQGFSRLRRGLAIKSTLGLQALAVSGLLLIPAVIASQSVDAVQPPQITAQVPLTARILYVNPVRGTDSRDAGSTEATPFKTITYALQQVQSGTPTVIQLTPGSYTLDTGEVFPLIVPSGVILRGNEGNKGQTVVIIGGGLYISPTFARQNITLLADQNTEIRGLTITNPNTRGTGVWVESTNPTIANNTFTSNKREGVFVTGTGTPKIEANVFTRNEGNGVSVARAARGEIRGNQFENTGFGLAIGGTSSPLVVGNQIIGNVDGVVVSDSATPTLRENQILNNTRDGVVAITNANPNLGTTENPGQNRIRNNTRYDVYNATRTNTIAAAGNDINPQRIQGLVNFTASTVTQKLPDIQGHWAQAYIQALVDQNVITGFPDGTFRPNEPVTRAQFATIITKALNPTAKRAALGFRDVPTNHWAATAIQSAYRGEFLAGYDDGLFRPDLQIPRVQVLVSLASGLGLRSDNLAALSVYRDAGQIPNWARTAIAGATQRQLVINYPQKDLLNPNQQATRAEVAAFVYQALVNAGRAPALPSPYLVTTP